MSARVHLHDERAQPPLRAVLGSLLSRATHADLAVAHVRLLAVNLSEGELARMHRCRVLLGRLDSSSFEGPAGIRVGADGLERLRRLVESGVAEVRSAGAPAWTPDFSVYRGIQPGAPFADGAACMIGAHYFVPPAVAGPVFTCLITERRVVDSVAARFEALWASAHGVGEAVIETIDGLRAGDGG